MSSTADFPHQRRFRMAWSFSVVREFSPDLKITATSCGEAMSHLRRGSAEAAVTGRGLSPECHRRPQLKHAYWRIETPVCMSMTLSAQGSPSHFQHCILFPLTSAPRLPLSGIVVLLGQALELLIQEDERVSGQRLTHQRLRFAVLRRDHSSAS
ncbi:MAG TPA: hypothetical protein VKB81_13130 [Nitrospira sp.]|nr:hypothetical protein [Nitrospira sp.]